ncbi:MAG: Rrf2 family transcriptional regulator [Clostridiales bacterium]|nr:Rrf2 family transcriptional regulator [Clostridiales bacterium]
MKISTRGRYALRLMLDIAQQGEGAVVSLTDIARRQDISVKYLEQIVMRLNRAGLLKSTRGVQGGYMLLRRPEEYSVGDILRAIEGNLAPISCLTEESNHCNRCHSCDTLWFWERMDNSINAFVDQYTLADFMNHPEGPPTEGEDGVQAMSSAERDCSP